MQQVEVRVKFLFLGYFQNTLLSLLFVFEGDTARAPQEWVTGVGKRGGVPWVSMNLLTLLATCKLCPQVFEWICQTHFIFADNLALEVLHSEALGLQVGYMIYYFRQAAFILSSLHLAEL